MYIVTVVDKHWFGYLQEFYSFQRSYATPADVFCLITINSVCRTNILKFKYT